MASDGISKRAQKGKCRICQRVRCTAGQVKAVGEIHHGFATGYIWECIDIADCDKIVKNKLGDLQINGVVRVRIEEAVKKGRLIDYPIYV